VGGGVGTPTNRSGLGFVRWTHIGLGAQDLNDTQRPHFFNYKLLGPTRWAPRAGPHALGRRFSGAGKSRSQLRLAAKKKAEIKAVNSRPVVI
jgi:hypothetical protein